MKNSLKGAGYFIGAVTVSHSYNGALGLLMGIIVIAMPWAVLGLDSELGRAGKGNISLRSVFRMNYNISMLSAARMFLFGSRCVPNLYPSQLFASDLIVIDAVV
jgi:hypothetical protein